MDIAAARSTRMVVFALLAIVALQLVYMAVLGGPKPAEAGAALTNADVIRYFDERGAEITTVWTIEALSFLTVALGSIVMLAHRAANGLVWAALALSGVFNTVQIGFGLAIFEPAARMGGDSTALFFTFVSGAFFYYFVAKLLIGIAAVVAGLHLFAVGAKGAKLAGILALLSGLAAAAANIAAMAMGNSVLMIAGATGTLATLFLAIALWTVSRRTI